MKSEIKNLCKKIKLIILDVDEGIFKV